MTDTIVHVEAVTGLPVRVQLVSRVEKDASIQLVRVLTPDAEQVLTLPPTPKAVRGFIDALERTARFIENGELDKFLLANNLQLKKVAFRDEFHDKIRSGVKTMTCRTSQLGKIGDRLVTPRGLVIELLDVKQRYLGDVAHQFYKQEGLDSPDDFIRVWNELHYGLKYNAEREAWLHTFRFVTDLYNGDSIGGADVRVKAEKAVNVPGAVASTQQEVPVVKRKRGRPKKVK